MSMSVPGNSCRTAPCKGPIVPGCTMRLSGKCVYYAGLPMTIPSIATGEDYDSIILKIIDLIEEGAGTVTSVGLDMPSAFSVTGSPVTTSGTLTVAGAGTASEFITGTGGLGTASNALVLQGGVLEFGGTLTKDTTLVSSVDGRGLHINGVNSGFGSGALFTVNNSAANDAIAGTSASGTGVVGISTSGNGVFGSVTTSGNGVRGTSPAIGVYGSTLGSTLDGTSIGVQGHASFGSYGIRGSSSQGRSFLFDMDQSNTNTVRTLGVFRRSTTSPGGAQNNIGLSLDFELETTGEAIHLSNQIISKWTNATAASRTSEFSITGVNSAVTATTLIVAGSGRVTLPFYGDGTFTTGTPTYTLAVDSSGVVMEVPLNPEANFYNVDGSITSPRTVTVGGFPLSFENVGLFRVTEGNVTVGGTYDFNDGVDFLSYNATNSCNLVMNPVSGLTFQHVTLAGPIVTSSISVNGSVVSFIGQVTVSTLDTDGSAPVTSGTTRMVICDENGLLSFTTIPSGGGGTVTNFSFTNGSGFTGNVTNAGTTPTLALTTSLTTGSVPFIGASGALSQSNAQLFWDNTNSRLGVGNNSPQEELHVTGTVRTSAKTASDNVFFQGYNSAGILVAEMKEASTAGVGGLQFSGERQNNSGGIGIFFNSCVGTTGNVVALDFRGSGGTIASPADLPTTTLLARFTARSGGTAVDRMVIDGSGNVGIGTSSPSGKLDLLQSGTNPPTLRFRDGDVTVPTYSSAGINPALTADTVGAIAGNGTSIGGLSVQGYSNNSATAAAMFLRGVQGSTAPTVPGVIFSAAKADGGTNFTTLAASEQAFQFRNHNTNLITVLGSGSVGIGIVTADAAAILQMDSTTKGFLPPRMTTAQRDLIASPPVGLIIFNTTTNKLNVRGASAWEAITSA